MTRLLPIDSLRRAAPLALLLALTSGAAGQSRQIPAPPQARPVLIHSATVHPVAGEPVENGFVLFEGGRIVEMGSGFPGSVDARTEQIDATDLHVYPGLVAAKTSLGLVETGAVDVTRDYAEYGRVTPEVYAAVALNPDSDLIPVARANGILLGLVFPQSGLISGRASSVRFDGWTWEDMAIDAHAGLVVSWPRTEPITAWWMDKTEAEQRKEIAEDLESVERLFDDAAAYVRARDADPTVRTDLRYEAMRPFLSGEKAVYVTASSLGQIESAVAWAVRRGLRIVIVGGTQADEAIPLLLKHEIPVIIDGVHRLPRRRHEPYDEPFVLARTLHEAGVDFCIASGASAAHERNLNHNAATAAAYGLPREVALEAVTLRAARIAGIGGDYGSLEPGKSATLIITTGDPLEIVTDTLVAYVDGRRIDLGSRHKSLYRKYREKYAQLGLLER